MKELAELLEKAAVDRFSQETFQVPDVEITGISYDSRKTAPGDAFVCDAGTLHHVCGRDFFYAGGKALFRCR